MKLYLYVLIFTLIATVSAYASDIASARSEISNKLNTVVKGLKEDFRDADTLINKNSKDVKVLEEQVNDLVVRSGAGETNPTILKHGKASVSRLSSCDYNSENLHWNGSDWVCQEIDVLSDCSPASDEYRVSTGSGSYSCQKNQSGSVINYYWKFTGNSITCSPTTGLYGKVYGCFYKNKLNQEIQVANSSCKGKSKPSATAKRCQAKPIYYCRAGLSLSGTRCVGTETINCDYYYPHGNHRKYVWDTGGGLIYIYTYHGQGRYYCINHAYRGCTVESGSMKGKAKFVKGKRVKRGVSGKGYMYQMCEQYSRNEAAQIRCPSGLRYNSSTRMCQ